MSGRIVSYQDLEVWKRALICAKEVYKITKIFPEDEKYGLISQIRRSAVSISANIAEGWGRESPKNFIQFLRTARGSLYEMDTLMTIAFELGYIDRSNREMLIAKTEEISKMLNGLIKKIDQSIKQ